jgi:hypothetical protein
LNICKWKRYGHDTDTDADTKNNEVWHDNKIRYDAILRKKTKIRTRYGYRYGYDNTIHANTNITNNNNDNNSTVSK